MFAAHSAYASATGFWSATGSMATAREQQFTATATLLPSGKVLVAGGLNGAVVYSSAELYDSGAGTWSPTGSMATPRVAHTATLLPSGKVLVAGGANNVAGDLSSAELYDPALGTWLPTASMASVRAFHTATLLLNGKVLVAGGSTTFDLRIGAVASAELYDPAPGTWSPTGSMTTPRDFYPATLLPNGEVLVAGGQGGGATEHSEAELYNPATGTWSPTGSIALARNTSTLTALPNGKVLLAGGASGCCAVTYAIAELYDPAPGTWSTTGSMTSARGLGHTATLLPSGKVLVAGGVGGASPIAVGPAASTLASAELYDPAAGTWSVTGSMSAARTNYFATLLASGAVLVAGGIDEGGVLASAELYSAKQDQTITFAALADKILGEPPFAVTATASSGLPVTFTGSGPCTVSGSTVTLTATGVCAITASQAGNGTFNAAPKISRSFKVLSPAQFAQGMIAAISGMGLPSGISNSLISKLQAYIASSARGDQTAACGQLGAFVNHVTAQSGKHIPAADATRLLADTARLRIVSGCK